MIKKLFFKEEESLTPKPQTSKVEKPATQFPTPGTLPSLSVIPVTETVSQSPSEDDVKEITDHLIDVFQKRNLPGPDYQEFANAISKLTDRPIDEATKYATVFAGFEVQGITKSKLKESAEFYIELFETEKESFSKTVDNVINNEIGDKNKNVEKLKAENEEIEAAMKQLSEKRAKNNELINSLTMTISKETNRLTLKKSTFETRANMLIQSIKSDIERIERYL